MARGIQAPIKPKKVSDQILLAVDAEECRRSLKQFLVSVWPIIEPSPFIDGWVIDALVEHFTALVRGDIRKIVVNIPPRHTKSLFLVAFRAWLWAINPQERILAASYGLDLSLRDNMRVRRIIEDPWFQERYGGDVQMRPDQNAKFYYENTAAGYQMALSVAGGVTGHGGSYLIIDDAHNALEAHSGAERETALMWFREVWSNRLNNASTDRMVVVGQRIHEEDVCGYILKERPDWTQLILPAEYEPARKCSTSIGWSDPRTKEDQLLWPERFAKETLDGLKRDLGSIGYAAQYQQSPVPSGGATFLEAWKRYFEIAGDYYILHTKYGTRKPVAIRSCQRYCVVDVAISEKQQADFTAIQTWDVTPENEALLLHQLRGHFNNPDQQKKIIELYERWLWMALYVETVAYQLALFQQLRNYTKEDEVAPGLYRKYTINIPVKEWLPTRGDKVVRAGVAAIKMEAGDMYWLVNAPYLIDLEPEVFKFPKSKKKDQVDCLGMICDILSNPRIPLSGDEPPATDWFHEAELKRQLTEKRELLARLQAGGVH